MLSSNATFSAIAQPSALDTTRPIPVSLVGNDPLTTSLSLSRRASAIAFVDGGLADYQTLVQGLSPDTAVYVLNPAGDELSQMTQVLAGYSDLAAVSIFSHGSDGALQLGSTSLNTGDLMDYAGLLQSWASSFSQDGDLLFYGCNLAADATGQSLVSQIAALTGADVAASTDLTGSSALGGNWTLEFATGSIAASEFLSDWAQAAYQHVLATYTVNTLSDGVDANDGVLSLREAIAAANASTGVADTINFAAGLTGTITLTNGQLVLSDRADTRISGGNAITVSGNNATRVFQVNERAIATLEGLTITGGSASDGGGINNAGYLTVLNSTISGNGAGNWGGGINNAGYLTVLNSTLSGNTGINGGGIYNNGILTVADSTLSGNSAQNFGDVVGSGGGIYNTGILTVSNSTLSGNRARGRLDDGRGGEGAGIYNTGIATVSTSILSANLGWDRGGGIYNTGTLTVSNSTLSRNRTNRFRIDTFATRFNKGGNIFNGLTGTMTISNSTLHGGESSNAGNVFSEGNLTVNSITSAGGETTNFDEIYPSLFDSRGTLSASNSLFIGSQFGDYAVTINDNPVGEVPGDNNWIGDGGYFYSDNGGPTPTVTFSSDSTNGINTINRGNTTLTTDQRGVARPQGAAADIGAVEFLPPGAKAVVFSNLRTFLPENFISATPLKVADIGILGGGTDPNVLSLSGADANLFDLVGNQLFLKANTPLDFETQPSLSVTVGVDGPDEDSSPDATGVFTLNVANLAESITFTVTNTNDSGAGSLRQAILNANASPGEDIVTFNSSLMGQTIALSSGELAITQGVSIDGDLNDDGTPDITVNANQRSRVFNVDDGTGTQQLVTLEGLIITGGGSVIQPGGGIRSLENLTVSNSTISDNEGGGIYLLRANLTVSNSTISGNSAGEGGGIYIENGSLTVSNSTIDNNTASLRGGGIYSFYSPAFADISDGSLTVSNSTISNNKTILSVSGEGGGIAISGGSLTVSNSTISGNTAFFGGGGISGRLGSLTVSNSTISNNSAPVGLGGGIFLENASNLTVRNSTLSNNSADEGGGIHSALGSLTVGNSTLSGNTATFGGGIWGGGTLTNTIVAGNSNTANADLDGAFTSGGYNLIGRLSGSGFTNGVNGDQVGVTDPGLAALANNGGLTATMALLGNSPAINAGTPTYAGPLTTDQRGTGFNRVVNGRIDIGAFEYVPPANNPPTATNLSAAETYTEDTSLNLTDIVISDIDSATVTATLTLSNPAAGSLTTATSGAVTSTYSATTGIWSASGAIADVNALLAGVTFTPTANFNGSFAIATSVTDGASSPITGTKTFTGIAVNDPPTATNLSAAETYTEDTPLNLTDIVIADVDSATVTATLTLSNPAAGSLTTATSGTVTSTYSAATGVWSASGAIADVNILLAGVTFTPTANFNGSFAIATSVTDGVSPAITGTKTFTGIAVNDAPALTGPRATLPAGTEDTPYTITVANLLAGFTDVDGDLLSVSGLTATNGSLTNNNNGTYTFTPNANYNGIVNLSYSVIDVNGGSVAASQSFTLAAVNDAPAIAAIPNQTAFQNTPGQITSVGPIAFTLSDVETAASALVVTATSSNPALIPNGNIVLGGSGANRTLTLTPANNRFGTATITVNVSDGSLTTSTTFTIDVGRNLNGGNGRDLLNGTNGNDRLDGGNNDDILFGGNGNDILLGGAGDDILFGGNGDDVLDGGTGNNILTGGTGADTFVLGRGGNQRITDFQKGSDRFRLTGGLTFAQLSFVRDGNNTRIRANGIDIAYLLNVLPAQLAPTDFVV